MKEISRARIVAFFLLLLLTLSVYSFWSYSQDVTERNNHEIITYEDGQKTSRIK